MSMCGCRAVDLIFQVSPSITSISPKLTRSGRAFLAFLTATAFNLPCFLGAQRPFRDIIHTVLTLHPQRHWVNMSTSRNYIRLKARCLADRAPFRCTFCSNDQLRLRYSQSRLHWEMRCHQVLMSVRISSINSSLQPHQAIVHFRSEANGSWLAWVTPVRR